jgi:hypothetical protein
LENLNAARLSFAQRTHAEAIAQLALFDLGRETLNKEPAVHAALNALAATTAAAGGEHGHGRGGLALCDESRAFAESALRALSDETTSPQGRAVDDGGQKHVMLSYQVRRKRLI